MIFSHVLYQLSYLAVWAMHPEGHPREDSRLREACYQGRGTEVGSGSLVMSRLFPGEPLELESRLEHLLGKGTHDGLGLFAGLE
jgi:hypothetical protein